MKESDLYALPLNEFTPQRNALAKEIKEKGEGSEAERIAKLAKPSVAAWAVNQLARSHTKEIDRLLSLRERLRSADTPDEMRKLSTERHQLISDLTERSAPILEEAGHAASGPTLAKISGTLYGANSDQERTALKNGTLARRAPGDRLRRRPRPRPGHRFIGRTHRSQGVETRREDPARTRGTGGRARGSREERSVPGEVGPRSRTSCGRGRARSRNGACTRAAPARRGWRRCDRLDPLDRSLNG